MKMTAQNLIKRTSFKLVVPGINLKRQSIFLPMLGEEVQLPNVGQGKLHDPPDPIKHIQMSIDQYKGRLIRFKSSCEYEPVTLE